MLSTALQNFSFNKVESNFIIRQFTSSPVYILCLIISVFCYAVYIMHVARFLPLSLHGMYQVTSTFIIRHPTDIYVVQFIIYFAKDFCIRKHSQIVFIPFSKLYIHN